MIIQCTACEKKFSVPDSAITGDGRLVQCSSCGNKWTQYPLSIKKSAPKNIGLPKSIYVKKTPKKNKGPVPYSREYMRQKWGDSLPNYVESKGLNKKTKKNKKISTKHKKNKVIEKPGFGFFNYIIMFVVLSTFFVGILNFEQARLSRKFPFLEPYIGYFFETIDNFKIFILDLL